MFKYTQPLSRPAEQSRMSTQETLTTVVTWTGEQWRATLFVGAECIATIAGDSSYVRTALLAAGLPPAAVALLECNRRTHHRSGTFVRCEPPQRLPGSAGDADEDR